MEPLSDNSKLLKVIKTFITFFRICLQQKWTWTQGLHFLSKVFVPGKKMSQLLRPWIFTIATCFQTRVWDGDPWWPRGWRGQCQGWVWDEESLVSVMMTPDSRPSCKIIYDPGSHTEIKGDSENMHFWELTKQYRLIEKFYFHVFGKSKRHQRVSKCKWKSICWSLSSCFIWELLCTFLWWPRLYSLCESAANSRRGFRLRSQSQATPGLTCLNDLSSHLEFISPPCEHFATRAMRVKLLKIPPNVLISCKNNDWLENWRIYSCI